MIRPVNGCGTVQVPGPLGSYAAEFGSQLLAAGYSLRGAKGQLWLMAHLSRWLAASGLPSAELDEQRVEQYLAVRRAAGCSAHYTRAGLTRLLDFLAAQGARPATQPVPSSATRTLVDGFKRYLVTERGLTPETVTGYVDRVERFVAEYTVDGNVGGITAADVMAAVVAEGQNRSVSAVQLFATSLR
jgi:site-specific recombinase XerD